MGYITNPDGLVILFYYQPVPKLVRLSQEKSVYFDCRYGVSLAFVSREDADILVEQLGGCCGGKRRIIFPASQVQYDHWLHGKGGR